MADESNQSAGSPAPKGGGLESALGDVFKNAPKLPDSAKNAIVSIAPWGSLIVGLIGLWGAWTIWQLQRAVERLDEALGIFGDYVSTQVDFGPLYYVSVAAILLAAVLELAAVPGLMNRKVSGWRFLFWGAIVNVVYSVVYFLANTSLYFGNMIMGLIGSVIGFYFLFQIRSYYK